MSNMKKKKMKQPTRLRTLVASLMLIAPAIHAANDTEFSSRPLVGVAASFAPHIALALSVEYPTAGAAYTEAIFLSTKTGANRPSDSLSTSQKYLGYFDNAKCYKYNHEQGHFYPSSKAQTRNNHYGLCNNTNGETEEFSGNMMNFMTMTAIDIFRNAMTGGNRAKGTGVTKTDYENGDTITETYLRRAKVQWGQNSLKDQKIVDRQLDVFDANKTGQTETLKRLLPHYFIDVMAKDLVDGENGTVNLDESTHNNHNKYGKPRRLNFRSIDVIPEQKKAEYAVEEGSGSDTIENRDNPAQPYTTKINWTRPAVSVIQELWKPAGEYDVFADNRLHFFNFGFTTRIVRKINKGVRLETTTHSETTPVYTTTGEVYKVNGQPYVSRRSSVDYAYLSYPFDAKYFPGVYEHQYYAVLNSETVDSKYRDDAWKWQKPLNVVIKVCDASVGLEENCESYGSGSKPEGLLQSYTKSNQMRFATFGYLNRGDVNGGVLRSRMKTLIKDPDSTKHKDEWNQSTGKFDHNPDAADAQASGVEFSGAINYLNRFGDWEGYKLADPAGELYETALTYLRGTHVGSAIHQPANLAAVTKQQKDNFPTIFDWDDPYKRGVPEKAQHCHANSIIFIGDTNTHEDRDFISDNKTNARTYLQNLMTHHNATATAKINKGVDDSFGYSNSPAYMAGLAYWARTNNIREDLTRNKEGANPINSSNFIIDVMEKNEPKSDPMHNTYYLAAKYGGFSINKDVLKQNFTVNGKKVLPDERDSWTDDQAGNPSITQFKDGVPRNFAIANNPSAMKAALGKAMSAGAALNNPSQAATGLSIGLGEILDVSKDGLNRLLQSTYDFANLTGDVVVYKPIFQEIKNEQTGTVERSFVLTEVARTGKILTTKYHGSNSEYAGRKVFTIKGNQPYAFTVDNASSIFPNGVGDSGAPNASALVKYILGDNSFEGTLRKRSGLQGTVINSTATPIVPVKNDIKGCAPFAAAAKSRPAYYAAAANDGMLHIFDDEGNEKMAYMAGTALEKLPEFAKVGFQHQYLNDGTPVVQDLCVNNTPQTVLVGTAGRGGASVYALDVTDISNPSTRNVKWEFTHPNLGLTISKPIITKSHDGSKQYAIVSSGYNNNSDVGHIFVLDLAKQGGEWVEGRDFWQIRLGKAGVGAPFVYDGENDGIGDKIFVGDLEGQVWQLNSTKDAGKPFKVAYGSETKPLFKPKGKMAKPITGAPYAEMVKGKLTVIVGTGRYFSEKDLSVTQQNYAYGLIADDQNPIEDNEESILEQNFLLDEVETKRKNAKVYAVSGNKMTDKHKGWRLTLMEGANIASNGLIRERQVANFIFARNTGEISGSCVRGANVGIVEIDVSNGGHFSKPVVDTNLDGQFDEKDHSQAAAIELFGISTSVGTFLNYRNPLTGSISPAIYLSDGGEIQTMKGVVGGDSDGSGSDGSGSGGPVSVRGIVVDLVKLSQTEAGVRRISWREIF